MKKPVIILLVFCIAISLGGCNNKTDNLDENNAAEGSTSNSNKAIWPTEKWSKATPEEQGMEASVLSGADKRIAANYPNIYSLLVVRHGYLVYEKYYQGVNENTYNPVYSVTKSVMSALTGIAIRDKLIESVDQKVADFFPEYFLQVDDNRKKDITVKNVLTMTGGLESIDSDYSAYFRSGDWLDYTIKKPLLADPGKNWAYNTGLTHLLSGIITKTSKMSTLEYAEKNLFKPLGISDIQRWDMDSKGYCGGGSGLSLTPKDMAKLGYLYLKDGMWEEKQIIPEEWVEEAIKKHVTLKPENYYGYLFWSWDSQAKVNGKSYYAYAASGAGGQYIVVVPDLDLVTVITADENSASKDKANTADIIWDYVIPAVK